MFTFLCCGDIHGEKVNLEITLEKIPLDLSHLEYQITRIFSREAQSPIKVACVYIYDDYALKWVLLENLDQLYEFDQLYIFQPQTSEHCDIQSDLPPPRPPRESRAASAVEGNLRRLSSNSVPPAIMAPRTTSTSASARVSKTRDQECRHSRNSDGIVDSKLGEHRCNGSSNYSRESGRSASDGSDIVQRLERLKKERDGETHPAISKERQMQLETELDYEQVRRSQAKAKRPTLQKSL